MEVQGGSPSGAAMPLFRKKEEEPEEAQSERLRKFRNMYAAQYGSRPVAPVKEVGEPIRVQALCAVCSEPMEGPTPERATCPAARLEPDLHERLRVTMQNWRGGTVQGRTVPQYNRTIGLMRQALKKAIEKDRAHALGASSSPTPATATASSDPKS